MSQWFAGFKASENYVKRCGEKSLQEYLNQVPGFSIENTEYYDGMSDYFIYYQTILKEVLENGKTN